MKKLECDVRKFRAIFIFIILFIACYQPYNARGKEEKIANDFSQIFYLGEKDFGDYIGFQQNIIYQDAYGSLKSYDEKLSNQYTNSLFFERYQSMFSFYESELPAGIFCSDQLLNKHFKSIRYYFRLLTLSHLFEAMKIYQKHRVCSFNFSKILKKCTPKTKWMKDITKLAGIAPALKTILINENRFFYDRDRDWCSNNNQSCKRLSPIGKRKQYCEQDIQNFQTICSEQDDLFGMNSISLPYWLIKRTHITDQFDSEEQALGCLKRFSQTMKHYEAPLRGLDSLFHASYESLPDSYKEGGLFAYGSLQRYGELTQIFKDSFEPAKDIVAIKDKEIRTVRVAEAPLIIKKVTVKKIPVVKKKKKPAKRYSAFYQACDHRQKYDLAQASVDMLKFHYDLVITGEKKEKADKLLEKFRQRKILESMKKYEKLGESSAPVPLVFLKYLIEARDYQGIFNIIAVLGDEFFVKNDFDPKESRCQVERVKIQLDRGKREWSLSVLKRDSTKI